MKTLFTFVILLIPSISSAAPYALELAQSCTMTVTDQYGGSQTKTEPVGYIYDSVVWDGVSAFAPLDPCGHIPTFVAQTGGVPAVGSGGVAITPTNFEVGTSEYNNYVSSGVTITSTQYGLVGTFAADNVSMTQIERALQYYDENGATFPNPGGWPLSFQTQGYALFSTNLEEYNALKAIEKWQLNCIAAQMYVVNGISNPPWPATSVTIP